MLPDPGRSGAAPMVRAAAALGAADLWGVPQVFLDYFNTPVLCGQLQLRTCGGDMKSTDLQPPPFP